MGKIKKSAHYFKFIRPLNLAACLTFFFSVGVFGQNLLERYDWLAKSMYTCAPVSEIQKNRAGSLLAPENTICLHGALAAGDPDYNRVLIIPTGTGIGNGAAGSCSLSSPGSSVNHDVYRFNLTGCAVFPTEITATLCGPAGCQHTGDTDTVLTLYRRVAEGNALTADGGIGSAFSPADPCTNALAANDDLGTAAGAANNTGGSTCNQMAKAQCIAPCTSPANAARLSGFRRQLGDGFFTLVVAGFSNTVTGGYTLTVDAPGAGCNVALAPTAAEIDIAGQVKRVNGRGITNATVTLAGGGLAQPIATRTNAFGYYTFPLLPAQPAGANYVLTVSSKGHTFAEPVRLITVSDDTSNVIFVSME